MFGMKVVAALAAAAVVSVVYGLGTGLSDVMVAVFITVLVYWGVYEGILALWTRLSRGKRQDRQSSEAGMSEPQSETVRNDP